MSTVLKRKFDFVEHDNVISVYSDHSRFFRESILFDGSYKVLTPHNAIKELCNDRNIKISLGMIRISEDVAFLKSVLLTHGVLENQIC